MKEVITEKNEQLTELSFEMMKIEMRKLQTENNYFYNIQNIQANRKFGYTIKEEEERYHQSIISLDKEGYSLSLAYNDLILQNGSKFYAFNNGPDATKIASDNLLAKNGLSYPISWYIISTTNLGIEYGYYKSDVIDYNHEQYLKQVEQLKNEGKVDEFMQQRLVLAGEYNKEHHKLLSKYFNGEDLEVSKGQSR